MSANPTGPLHVGHGRQGALGDAIAALLESQGQQVSREFYYNDSGAQIEKLALSVQARAKGIKPGEAGLNAEDLDIWVRRGAPFDGHDHSARATTE